MSELDSISAGEITSCVGMFPTTHGYICLNDGEIIFFNKYTKQENSIYTGKYDCTTLFDDKLYFVTNAGSILEYSLKYNKICNYIDASCSKFILSKKGIYFISFGESNKIKFICENGDIIDITDSSVKEMCLAGDKLYYVNEKNEIYSTTDNGKSSTLIKADISFDILLLYYDGINKVYYTNYINQFGVINTNE